MKSMTSRQASCPDRRPFHHAGTVHDFRGVRVFLLMFVIVVRIFWVIGLMGWVGIPIHAVCRHNALMLGINIPT